MKIGEKLSWQRTFSADDIRLFNQVSGDEGVHHVTPDAAGRLMVHGLLTATLPTKIGGDLNLIGRELNFQFHRPVFAGDTIDCECTIVALQPAEHYLNVRTEFVCRNQHGKDVMTGYAQGVIRQPRAQSFQSPPAIQI